MFYCPKIGLDGMYGGVNMAGIQHYNKLIDVLLQKGFDLAIVIFDRFKYILLIMC